MGNACNENQQTQYGYDARGMLLEPVQVIIIKYRTMEHNQYLRQYMMMFKRDILVHQIHK